jgi:hypothetical protein
VDLGHWAQFDRSLEPGMHLWVAVQSVERNVELEDQFSWPILTLGNTRPSQPTKRCHRRTLDSDHAMLFGKTVLHLRASGSSSWRYRTEYYGHLKNDTGMDCKIKRCHVRFACKRTTQQIIICCNALLHWN